TLSDLGPLAGVRAFTATTILHHALGRLGFEPARGSSRGSALIGAYQRALLASLRPAGRARLDASVRRHARQLWVSREALLARFRGRQGAARGKPGGARWPTAVRAPPVAAQFSDCSPRTRGAQPTALLRNGLRPELDGQAAGQGDAVRVAPRLDGPPAHIVEAGQQLRRGDPHEVGEPRVPMQRGSALRAQAFAAHPDGEPWTVEGLRR